MNSLKYSLAIAVLTAGITSASSAEDVMQSASMHLFEDLSIIENAKAELTRMDHGIYMKVQTNDLAPGHVVTMWYVVFNNPEKCSGGECGEDDVFNLNADGASARRRTNCWQ
jgi:hypothetical protein